MIKGLMKYPTKIISLDEFFEKGKELSIDSGNPSPGHIEPVHWVKVRPFPPYSAAQIETLNTSGIKIHANKSTTIETNAETKMKIRRIKLTVGVGIEDHNFKDENGKTREWNDQLIKELDGPTGNPAVLKKVMNEINKINEVDEGENPT